MQRCKTSKLDKELTFHPPPTFFPFSVHYHYHMPIYKLSKNATLETFNNGGLVLLLPERRLVELNPSAVKIVQLLDGQRSPEQVALVMAKTHDISNEPVTNILQDVLDLCRELLESGVLEQIPDPQENHDMTTTELPLYLCNPDVVTREEDPDEGALLFNPDTNQVKVINTTGLFIWQQCIVARTLEQIIAEVQKDFDEVPLEQVAQDVKEFVDGMLATGFIGTIEQ
jgi:hypothetical protein